jgi:co-chaperonin GroES (HSP10)
VVTAQYAGHRIKGDDGKEYVVCNDEDIIAILKEANV